MLWTFSQILIPIKFLPQGLLNKIEIFKSAIPIFLALVSIILYRKSIRLIVFLWPFIAFIFYLVLTNILKFFINTSGNVFDDILKYFLWTIVIFFVFPKIFNTLHKIRFLLKYSIILIVFFIVLATMFLLFQGLNPLLFINEGRMELLYGNPLYLGGISYTVLCSSMILLKLFPSTLLRYFLIFSVLLSFLLIYLATARTFLLATAVMFVIYSYYTNKHFKALIWVWIFPFLIGIYYYFNSLDINKLSSNRLYIWQEALASRMNIESLLFGNFELGYIKNLNLESGESVVQSFQRYAIDNSYIEIFINSGVIGFFLFIIGLKNILSLRNIWLVISDKNRRIKNIFYISYSVLISLLVSAFFYGFYPSFGNTLNSVLFPVVISILFLPENYIFEILKTKN